MNNTSVVAVPEVKLTKKDWFAKIYDIVEKSNTKEKQGILDFILHEVELLERKKSSAKPTKEQEKNREIESRLEVAMASIGKPSTVTEILRSDDNLLKEISTQKASALLNAMVKREIIVKTTEKKKSYFSLISAE